MNDLIKELRAYVNNDASYENWKRDIEEILSRHQSNPIDPDSKKAIDSGGPK